MIKKEWTDDNPLRNSSSNANVCIITGAVTPANSAVSVNVSVKFEGCLACPDNLPNLMGIVSKSTQHVAAILVSSVIVNFIQGLNKSRISFVMQIIEDYVQRSCN
jgi:hypothetical protein